MKTLIILIMGWILFTGCDYPIVTPKQDTKIQTNVIYSVEAYKKLLNNKTNDLDISLDDLSLLEEPHDKENRNETYSLKFNESIHQILDILKTKEFAKKYHLNELKKFVYKNNKAIAFFISNNLHDDKENSGSYCVGNWKELFFLKDNILYITYLDGESGEIAIIEPISK